MSPEGYASWCLNTIRRDISEDRIPLYINFSGRTELGEVQEHIVRGMRGAEKHDDSKLKEELGDVAFLLYAKCALTRANLAHDWDTSGKIQKRPGIARIINTLCLLNEADQCAERLSEAFRRDSRPEVYVEYLDRLCACLGWSMPDVVFLNRVKIVQRISNGTLINKENRTI